MTADTTTERREICAHARLWAEAEAEERTAGNDRQADDYARLSRYASEICRTQHKHEEPRQ